MKAILCVPAHREDFIETALSSGAEKILWDLEDSVPDDRVEDAVLLLSRGHVRPTDAVRIRPMESGRYHQTLAAAVRTGAEIWLPKVRRPACLPAGLTPILETPEACLRASEFLGVEGLSGIAFGEHDLLAEGLAEGAVEAMRPLTVVVAAALGIPSYDSPCADLSMPATRSATERACHLGFAYKGAMHPEQIQVIHSVGPALRRPSTGTGIVREGSVVIGPPMRKRSSCPG
jgi:citrate lyase beta subunit